MHLKTWEKLDPRKYEETDVVKLQECFASQIELQQCINAHLLVLIRVHHNTAHLFVIIRLHHNSAGSHKMYQHICWFCSYPKGVRHCSWRACMLAQSGYLSQSIGHGKPQQRCRCSRETGSIHTKNTAHYQNKRCATWCTARVWSRKWIVSLEVKNDRSELWITNNAWLENGKDMQNTNIKTQKSNTGHRVKMRTKLWSFGFI